MGAEASGRYQEQKQLSFAVAIAGRFRDETKP
jgi:hypothetical protein